MLGLYNLTQDREMGSGQILEPQVSGGREERVFGGFV